jgi:NADPH2:quinone reductase
MRFVHLKNSGGPEVLELREGPAPSPGRGEIQIRVRAAGVNRPDIAQRQGTYPPPPGASPVLGLEVAGEVAAVGEGVRRFRIGDPVCALTPGGGYAEYCLAPEAQSLAVPKGLGFEEAAAVPETFFTVWLNVFMKAALKAGEDFLVHGGSSGIGVAAIQLAKARGARVLTTAGSSRKCDTCRSLGADLAVNYKEQDFAAEVKRFTNEKGVHVILDMVGGPYLARNVDCLAPDGRLVQIAVLQGATGELSLGKLLMKRLTLMGSTLRPLPVERKGEIARELEAQVWPLLESGKVKVVIERVFPLAEVAEAHRLMETSAHIGKIVLKV